MSDQENKEVEETDQEDAQTPEGTSNDLDTLKSQVADAYIDLIDTTKGSLFQLGAMLDMTKSMKERAKNQLLGKEEKPKKIGFLKRITDKMKEKFLGTASGQQNLLSYDAKDLGIMKNKITSANQEELENLLIRIQKGENPAEDGVVDPNKENNQPAGNKEDSDMSGVIVGAGLGAGDYIATQVESNDKDHREKFLLAVNDILKKDAKSPIEYKWGSKDDAKGGLDCSGLVYHAVESAGLVMPRGDSREMFKHITTKQVEVNDDANHSIKETIKDFGIGDLLFWNSTDSTYKRSAGAIPSIEKDSKKYRIHHVAIIEKINYTEGTIDVVESNGSEGVTKSTINAYHRLAMKNNKQSELYVGKMDYDDLKEQKKLAA